MSHDEELDEAQQRVLAELPKSIPCASQPEERMGKGKCMFIDRPVSVRRDLFTKHQALGIETHYYVLEASGMTRELVTRQEAVQGAAAWLRSGDPDAMVDYPGEIGREIEQARNPAGAGGEG